MVLTRITSLWLIRNLTRLSLSLRAILQYLRQEIETNTFTTGHACDGAAQISGLSNLRTFQQVMVLLEQVQALSRSPDLSRGIMVLEASDSKKI